MSTTPEHVRKLNAAARKGNASLGEHVASVDRVRDYSRTQLDALANLGWPGIAEAARAELVRRESE